MTPILFSKTATTFTTNGIGRLECISCVVFEERNGIYELEAECPVSGNHVSDLEIDSIIAVIPYDGGTMQGFRVYEITKPLNGKFTVYARHVSYQLLNIPSAPFSVAASASACATTLATLKTNAYENCPFTFWTDITTAGSYSQTVPAAIRQRLLGTEGSVLDQFGGEYEWDNYTVKLHRQRGKLAENNGIVLRYGKNITDIKQEENISNVITGVVPFWADTDGNVTTLPNNEVVYSQYASRYPFKRTVPLDLSDKWQEAPSESALRTAAQAFVNNSELGVPKVSIEVSFVALWQSEEYKDVLPLQRVKLCDEITVIFEEYGIERIAKVVKTEYNVLKERYDKIQVGDLRSTFTMAVNDMNAQTIKEIEAQSVATSEAINNATKWLTSAGGYVIAIKNNDGSWKELAFSNMTNPYATNAKVLRINNNGLGFSTTGLNGTFTNAWTIDGNLVADFIHGGTLTLGGNGNGNGWLKIVDTNGTTQIGKWDVNGIDIDKGDINLGSGKFHVTNAGVLTATSATITGAVTATSGTFTGAINATSGTIGDGNSKFTITGNHIANGKGSLTDNNNGVYVGTDGIALGQDSKFKVDSQGALNATNASVSGTISSSSNGSSVTLQNGKISCVTPDAQSNDSFKIHHGDDELSIGIDDFYIEYGDHHEEVRWHDIYSLVSNYLEHGGWW